MTKRRLPPYRSSLAGTLLSAREAVMRPIRPTLRDAGLTEQQWRVLRVLIDEGELDPSRLAEAALLHAPSVTRILRELVERNLVERNADLSDGRRSIIKATSSGEAMVEHVSKQTLLHLDRYGEAFGRSRLDALRSELTELATVIEGLRLPE